MDGVIRIEDSEFKKLVRDKFNEELENINLEALIESKVNSKLDKIISSKISSEKVENFAKDRISRIITTESLKEYTFGISDSEVLSNIESKIILMIRNSNDFKLLVKQVLKSSL